MIPVIPRHAAKVTGIIRGLHGSSGSALFNDTGHGREAALFAAVHVHGHSEYKHPGREQRGLVLGCSVERGEWGCPFLSSFGLCDGLATLAIMVQSMAIRALAIMVQSMELIKRDGLAPFCWGAMALRH
eukprot:scaffold314667_cov26-Tisochrysis_lutea.AAC.1